jgi:2-polyprenyl-3-methyl-5-hydroxy-6-metoxy-1,4-benzoquinol methylase
VAFLEKYYSGAADVRSLAKGRYTLLHCQTCASCFQQHILNDQGMDALYEKWIPVEDSFRKKAQAPLSVRVGYARQCTQIVRALKRPPHEIQVLDFGMGWGTWLMMARAFGMQVTGLELSPKRVEYARSNGLRVVTPEEIAPETIDFINAEQVFEHLPEPITALQSCYRWLKAGGILRIAVPNGSKVSRITAQKKWHFDTMPTIPLEHINTFTPQSLHRFAETHGFRVIHPPLVLPSTGFQVSDIRQFLGILAADLGTRINLWRSTTVWLQKKEK